MNNSNKPIKTNDGAQSGQHKGIEKQNIKSKLKVAENTQEQGQSANIKQNITNQGRQQDR